MSLVSLRLNSSSGSLVGELCENEIWNQCQFLLLLFQSQAGEESVPQQDRPVGYLQVCPIYYVYLESFLYSN